MAVMDLAAEPVASSGSNLKPLSAEVVACGWTWRMLVRTVGLGRPGLASLTPRSGEGSGPSRIFPWVFRVGCCLFFCIFQGEIVLPNLDSRVFHLRLWIQVMFPDEIDGCNVGCRDSGERC